MYQIKTMNKISQVGLAQLDAARFVTGDNVENEDAILVRSAKLHDYEFPANLQAIARAGAGVNNIPLDRAAQAGIVVFNTPGANANAVKELALCSLLMCSRNISGGVDWLRAQAKEGVDITTVVEKGKAAYVGPEIAGKTLGVVGLGAIGVKVANAADALGMKIVGYDPYLSVAAALALDPDVRHVTDLDEIYAACDYISLHLPMNDVTRGMLNKDSFAKMKDGVRIVNLARGELAVEADMIEALRSGKVAAYATDFPTTALALEPNVIPLPHLGASTPESEDNCAMMAAKQVQDYLDCGNIVNSVNLPNLAMPWNTSARLCMIHRNDPGMVAAATALLSKEGVNVEAMASQSRGSFAYMILDVNAPIPDSVKTALEKTDGVIRVRVLSK